MREKKVLIEKTKDFAVRIVNLYKYLVNDKKEYILSKQVLRSGTSIGANASEAMSGQSRSDFISKLSISLKEASETKYWLELLMRTDYIQRDEYKSLNDDCMEIIKILTSIIKTAKKKE